MKVFGFVLLGFLGSFPDGVRAQPADLNLRQLNHRVFNAIDGAPMDMAAIVQTPDGTLWIGGRTGLSRFDGVRFVQYPGPGEESLPGTNIATLFTTAGGGLWIGFRPGGAAQLIDGLVMRFGVEEGLPDGTVEQFAQDANGTIWAASRRGLARFNGQRWEKYSGESGLETPYWLLVDRSGTFWVGADNGLYARKAGEADFRAVDRRLSFGTGGRALVEAPDGAIWASPHYQLLRLDSPNLGQGAVTPVAGITSGPLMFDSQGNLWGSDHRTRGVLRVPLGQLAGERKRGLTLVPEHMQQAADVNSERLYALFEDREKNIWAGTDMALHRFSRSNVIRSVMPRCFQYGFTAAAIAPGDDRTLWVACDDTAASRLFEVRDEVVVSVQPAPSFSVASRDSDGTVWFAGANALGHIERGRLVMAPYPVPVLGRPVAALARDRQGALWVSVTRDSLYRRQGDEWVKYGGLETLPRTWPIVGTTSEEAVVWFGYSDDRVARVDGDDVQVFDARRGLAVGNVLAILAQEGEVWVGGELGLARLDGNRFLTLRSDSEDPFKGISGIVRARNGDLWLNGIKGIVRIDGDEIEGIVRDATYRVKCEIFNYLDGVTGTAVQLRPQPSAVQTSDGRIWFSMTAGIVSVDAQLLVRNLLPPPVTIWSLSSNSRRYANSGTELSLPRHTTDLQIEYTAGSLTVPERVRFRHKLEGLDSDWHDAGARREALYTNLGPGRYTFRVIASNNDGVWNDNGASLAFTIAPAFYQTSWFYALCALAGAGVLALIYRMRLRQVAAQVRSRLEARLAERERIARELHDTLLQGIQGLIWRFQAATERIPKSEPARQLMEQSLDRADKLLGESRDRVKDLRPTVADTLDLTDVLAAEGEQLSQLHHARFRISVQGAGRDLHPIVREEVLLICREALANAFMHAGAAHIEADMIYDEAVFQVRIRDDGQGISAAVLDSGGKPGHFGLMGMRERANKLGAQLEIWSRPGAGTEIDLRVPARVAYSEVRPMAFAGASR
jgi:signal transduction histidine kinase/ligand-binding sensor domain-containing protein